MRFSCLLVIVAFVFLVQEKRTYVTCQFSAGIRFNHFGPLRVGQNYHGTCFATLSPSDNITNVDAYWSFGNINYCLNDQKLWSNRNYTCGVRTVQNDTFFDLRVPDLTLSDGGIYSCRVDHNTRGLKTTFTQNVTVLYGETPKPTTNGETPKPTTIEPGSIGSSIDGNVLSTVLTILVASLIHS